MANVYQQAAKQRKAIYLGSIVVLLILSLAVRGTFSGVNKRTVQEISDSPLQSITLDGRAKVHELTELHQGETELSGAAIRLLLTGSRGLAVCALWNNAEEKKKKQEWSELDITVDSIAKLQPHTIGPWLFQSWNLTYNVSVEMDRLNDMYFYIARGITIAAEGESLNRNNPDLRYSIGFFYQNKFGVSDRVTTLRCLYQLSCIPDEDRDPDRLVTINANGTRTVNVEKFEDFCRAHPQFVRRLKETRIATSGDDTNPRPLASSRDEVVSFLRNNRKLPSRYPPGTRELAKDRLKQFPVLPDLRDQPVTTRELNFEDEFADHDQDASQVARAWYTLANASLPPPSPIPSNNSTYNPDPLKYRIPKRPATIIFRQGPMRAQTYLAERLTKEGWFDQEPWAIDDLIDPERAWIPKTGPDGQPVSARFATQRTAMEAWQEAAQRWQAHGLANGLRLAPATMLTYIGKAQEYCRLHPGLRMQDLTPALTPEEAKDERLRDLHDSHDALTAWVINRHMTNYEVFEVEAMAMQTPDAMLAKKRFFQAEKAFRNANLSDALRLYDEGFEAWKRVLVAHQDCRQGRSAAEASASQVCHDFRDLDRYAEEAYQHNDRYVKLARDIRQRELRSATLLVNDLISHAGPASIGNPYRFACDLSVLGIEVERGEPKRIEARTPQLAAVTPLPLPGPMDGLAPDGTPWISPSMKERVLQKLGIKRTVSTPAPNSTTGPGAAAAAIP